MLDISTAAAFVITFFLALALALVTSPLMIWVGRRVGVATKAIAPGFRDWAAARSSSASR